MKKGNDNHNIRRCLAMIMATLIMVMGAGPSISFAAEEGSLPEAEMPAVETVDSEGETAAAETAYEETSSDETESEKEEETSVEETTELSEQAPTEISEDSGSADENSEVPAEEVRELIDNGDSYQIRESGVYRLSGEQGSRRVSVDGEGKEINVTLILEDTKIDAGNKDAAIELAPLTHLTAIIKGVVELAGKNAIKVIEGSDLIIEGDSGKDGTDKLIAEGRGSHGNAIGYFEKDDKDSGNITIRDLNSVTAIGGQYGVDVNKDNGAEGGAAIGGGRINSSENGNVTIEHVSQVVALGGSKAAAIGANFWRGATVIINDVDDLYAEGGASSAAIGTSRNVGTDNRNVKENISNTVINITDSNITAVGGYYGAGIGTGYYNKCWGDYTRTAQINNPEPETRISITGNSVINATGGTYGAAIGGGYKFYGPEIFIGNGVTVAARAGMAGASGSLVPEVIGSGADGTSIYSAERGTVAIEDGASVILLGHGYDAIQIDKADKTGVLGSKWAVGRELDDTNTTACILQVRLLVNNFFNEDSEMFDGMSFFENDGEDHDVVLINADTGAETSFRLPAGYTTFAVSVPEGEYILAIDGEEYSFLATRAYNAVTTGAMQNRIYGDDEVPAGADDDNLYAEYSFTFTMNNTTNIIRYAFDEANTGFLAGKGVNSFDAVAIRNTIRAERRYENITPEETPDEIAPEGTEPEEIPEQTSETPADQASPAAPAAAAEPDDTAGQTVTTAVAATAAAPAAAVSITDQATPAAGSETIATIGDDDVPLGINHDHADSITHFLLLALTFIVAAIYTKRRKDVENDIYELEEKIGM